MANVFIDNITEFNQYDIDLNKNVFDTILSLRQNSIDPQRFFLKYISSSELKKYDFSDKNSINEFRDARYSNYELIKGMAGCNYAGNMGNDIREYGIILSDPSEIIKGQFNITDNIMTYSPIFPFFYEQRDLIKFASDTYFTSLTFEELLLNQINNATDYYVHVGNYRKAHEIANYGVYILEENNKEQMIEYATNPELGTKVLKKYLNIK